MTMFRQQDWVAFRSLDGLCRKAGVPLNRLRRLVVKELTDNALDAAGACRIGHLDGGYYIADEGTGIPGNANDIAELFSIRRPLTSSKLLRMPTRGALGNGLRVVAGAILASGGSLEVITGGNRHRLAPRDDGSTAVETTPEPEISGTCVEVRLGDDIPFDMNALHWAYLAIEMADGGKTYEGKTSAHWYDRAAFFELLQAAGRRPVREVMTNFDGLSGAKAGAATDLFKGRPAVSLSRDEATRLLTDARSMTKPVAAKRLGVVGKLSDWNGYGKEEGAMVTERARSSMTTETPFVVEAWTRPDSDDTIDVLVNRAPIVTSVDIQRNQKRGYIGVFESGLSHLVKVGAQPIGLRLNITTPYMPILSDGKAPNLEPFVREIVGTLEKAARQMVRACGGDARPSQKDIIIENLPAAIDKVSGGGTHRFSQRQLFYVIRPELMNAIGREPEFNHFNRVITDYEAENGIIAGLYRDNRGTLYHPHIGEEIPLGTLSVEQYRRPEWAFRRVLYSEKEGLFAILKAAKWPERHDCALLTSKGFASRAARDLLDFLGETGEPIEFYAIHDADGSGTLIYQALQEATKARPGRRFEIINLGLEPREAIEMGLDVETFKRGKKSLPTADYVSAEWTEWLQTNRVELNAMTSPQFVAWLDRKIADHGDGKLVPPDWVVADRYEAELASTIREETQARILAEANLDGQVAAQMEALVDAVEEDIDDLLAMLRAELEAAPVQHWSAPVDRRVKLLRKRQD